MINAIMIFGPAHGKMVQMQSPLQEQLIIPETEPTRLLLYDRDEHGREQRLPVHYYQLHDVFESDTEEVAVYFHTDGCCNKTYEKSQYFNEQCDIKKPPVNARRGRRLEHNPIEPVERFDYQPINYGDPSRPSRQRSQKPQEGPSKQEFDFMAARVQARQSGKSDAYITAMEAMDRLINEEKGKK